MGKLTTPLRDELGQWKRLLPPSWMLHFRDVELNFEAVDTNAELKTDAQTWPPRNPLVEQATARSFEQGNLTDWLKDIKVRRQISPSLKSIVCTAAATNKANAKYDLISTQDVDDGDEEWRSHTELARGLSDGKNHSAGADKSLRLLGRARRTLAQPHPYVYKVGRFQCLLYR